MSLCSPHPGTRKLLTVLLPWQDAVFRALVEGAGLGPVRTVYSPDGLKVYRTPDDTACVALQAGHPPPAPKHFPRHCS